MVSVEDTSPAPTVTGEALVGQKIFLSGVGAGGAAVRFPLGSDDVGTSACANCHGKNGRGGDGPMITWSMLGSKAKMEGMPKYVYSTPDQVIAAFTRGVRPDGTKLTDSMPRFTFSADESAGIIAYLKALQ